MNAFSTKQLLEMIDSKLAGIGSLPPIDLNQSLEFDKTALLETAFMRVMKQKYADLLTSADIDLEIPNFSDSLTLSEAKKRIPEIQETLLQEYEKKLKNALKP